MRASGTDDGLPYAATADSSTPTTLIAGAPNVSFSVRPMGAPIVFQGPGVCESLNVAEPGHAAAALASSLADDEISRVAYDEFVERLNGSQDLRSAVLYAYKSASRRAVNLGNHPRPVKS